jgi:hypothetical protein
MKKITHNLKKIALAVTMAAGAFSMPTPAHAYESDPWFHEWVLSEYAAFVSEVDNQFFAINTYLSEIYTYMISGEGDTGTGIIKAITGNMNKIWAEQQQFTEATNKNAAQMGRVTATDAAVSNRIAASLPDPRACDEIPKVMGGRMGGGGGGGSRNSKGAYEAPVVNKGGGTSLNNATQAGQVYGTHAGGNGNNYCSTADVKYTNGEAHAAFGCSAASTTMPDGDARVQSLFIPAHDYNNASVAAAQSITFKPESAKAAQDAATSILSSFSPAALPKDLETSSEGKTYLARVKVYNARISPAVHALAQLASSRSPDLNLPAPFKAAWMSVAQPVFAHILPGVTVPEVPSEAEVTRFEVLRRYADFGTTSWANDVIKDTDQGRLLQMLNTTEAVKLYVEWQIHNRMEENNALQAAILAQLTNPINKGELDKNFSAAVNTRK